MRISILGALCILGIATGCGAATPSYPATDAERAGMAMTRRAAVRALDCAAVEVSAVLTPLRVCVGPDWALGASPDLINEACERWREHPRVPGEELLARGCGRQMRFYCGGCDGDLSVCLTELQADDLCCGPGY